MNNSVREIITSQLNAVVDAVSKFGLIKGRECVKDILFQLSLRMDISETRAFLIPLLMKYESADEFIKGTNCTKKEFFDIYEPLLSEMKDDVYMIDYLDGTFGIDAQLHYMPYTKHYKWNLPEDFIDQIFEKGHFYSLDPKKFTTDEHLDYVQSCFDLYKLDQYIGYLYLENNPIFSTYTCINEYSKYELDQIAKQNYPDLDFFYFSTFVVALSDYYKKLYFTKKLVRNQLENHTSCADFTSIECAIICFFQVAEEKGYFKRMNEFQNESNDNVKYTLTEKCIKSIELNPLSVLLNYKEPNNKLDDKELDYELEDKELDYELKVIKKKKTSEAIDDEMSSLDSLFVSINPESITEKKLLYNPEEDEEVERLSKILDSENSELIQDTLFDETKRNGLIIMLFGDPGTGKTETCLQIARKTGRQLLILDVSKIINKWVGDSEKNVKRVFESYNKLVASSRETGKPVPILLLNEADSFLSKRIDVGHSFDQTINNMQNIYLQEFEKTQGIIICTTNLLKNIDPAFDRRILFKINFHRPNVETRVKLWKLWFPELSDDQCCYLANTYEISGGNFENVRRKSIIDKLIYKREVTIEVLEKYLKNESMINKSSDSMPKIKGFGKDN